MSELPALPCATLLAICRAMFAAASAFEAAPFAAAVAACEAVFSCAASVTRALSAAARFFSASARPVSAVWRVFSLAARWFSALAREASAFCICAFSALTSASCPSRFAMIASTASTYGPDISPDALAEGSTFTRTFSVVASSPAAFRTRT